jgi:hypothetical protein
MVRSDVLTVDGTTSCRVNPSAEVSYRVLALGRGVGIALLNRTPAPKT